MSTIREQLIELFYDNNVHCNRTIEHIVDDFVDIVKSSNEVIVPPCKVGDTVYRVMSDKRIKHPYEYKVIGFWYSADETCNNLHLVRYVNDVFDSSMSVPFSEFNRILFSTKDGAEKVLKERDVNK